jgi:hypothetical protein
MRKKAVTERARMEDEKVYNILINEEVYYVEE